MLDAHWPELSRMAVVLDVLGEVANSSNGDECTGSRRQENRAVGGMGWFRECRRRRAVEVKDAAVAY